MKFGVQYFNFRGTESTYYLARVKSDHSCTMLLQITLSFGNKTTDVAQTNFVNVSTYMCKVGSQIVQMQYFHK
jgi:hypothetical protein